MGNKYKALFSNMAIFAISNVISKLILSLLLPLYTRTMTAGEYGTVELITTLSQLLYPALSLSIQDSAFRFAMDRGQKAAQVLKNSLLVIFAGCVVFIPLSFGLNGYRGIEGYWFYFYLFSTLSMIRSMLSLYVKGINKTVAFSVDVVLYNGVLAVANFVLLAWLNQGIDGYFIAIAIASSVSIGYLLLNANVQAAIREKLNRRLMKEMVAYSAPLILNSISWGLTHVVDRMMLTSMMGSDANGIYSAASKIPSLMSVVTTVFTQAWTISLIQDYETERDKRFYNTVFRITHLGSLICALGILLFNNNLLRWILGSSFVESVRYVPILLIGTLFLTYSNFFGSFFSATKKSALNMYTSLAGCVYNIVFNLLLIPKLGIAGACIATAGSYVVIAIARMISSQRVYPIDLEVGKFSFSMILLLACAGCAFADRYTIPIVILGMGLVLLLYRDVLLQLITRMKSGKSETKKR